jgi:GMP synthase PP-ATPase subunit
MSDVCEQLYKDIPVDITYYLYASGDVSIIQVPYIKWSDSNNTPKQYEEDPLYKQLSGGTNSDAIADVITQQLSDKWLNIIVTDGDLNSLMARQNIHALLKNVFVVSVSSELDNNLKGISIRNKNDVTSINSMLQSVNLSG